MNDGPIFEWGLDMTIEDDVADDESSSADDDVSMSSVSIVPFFLPQLVPPFPADDVSIHSVGSTTDADVNSADYNTATLVPVDFPVPIDDAPADVPLDPAIDDLLDAASRDILVPDAVPSDPIDADVANPPADVSFDDVADASTAVPHEAPDPVASDVLAHDNAVEVTIDEPTNTYNLRSRSAPTFGSYSNPNNVQLHQQTHRDLDFSINIDDTPGKLDAFFTEQPYLHHQAQANNRHLPTFDEVQAGYNPTLGELRGMTYQYLVNTQMNATKGIKLHGGRAVEALLKSSPSWIT